MNEIAARKNHDGKQVGGVRCNLLPAKLMMILSLTLIMGASVEGFAGDGVKTFRAVIVGISEYKQAKLDAPSKDADLVAEALLASSSWKVENIDLLKDADATKANILAALKNMGDVADDDDVCFFYYSGHGTFGVDQEPLDEEDGFDELLCPIDIDDGQTLSDDEISDCFMEYGTANIFVVLDSCFSGGVLRNTENAKQGLKSTRKDINKGVQLSSARQVVNSHFQRIMNRKTNQESEIPLLKKRFLPPKINVNKKLSDGFINDLVKLRMRRSDLSDLPTIFAISACDRDQTSYEDYILMHGAFTYFLIDSLETADANGNGWVSGEELYKTTVNKLQDYSLNIHQMDNITPRMLDKYPGEFDLFPAGKVEAITPPVNNNWEQAIALETDSGNVDMNLYNATMKLWELPTTKAVWYKISKAGYWEFKLPETIAISGLTIYHLENDKLTFFNGGYTESYKDQKTNQKTYQANAAVYCKPGETLYIRVGLNSYFFESGDWNVDGYYIQETTLLTKDEFNLNLSWSRQDISKPVNDSFDDAMLLQGESGSIDGNNILATIEKNEPSHFSYSDYFYPLWNYELDPKNTVWYKITPAKDAVLHLTIRDRQFIPSLTVYEGARKIKELKRRKVCSSGQYITDHLSIVVKAGVTYHLVVASQYEDMTGSAFKLDWSMGERPVNDDMANAQIMEGREGTILINPSGATAEKDEPGHESIFSNAFFNYIVFYHGIAFYNTSKRRLRPPHKTLWYKWTAPADGTLSVNLMNLSSTSSYHYAVYLDSNSLKDLKAVNTSGQRNTHVFKDQTYLIVIDSLANGSEDNRLQWKFYEETPAFVNVRPMMDFKMNAKHEKMLSFSMNGAAPPVDFYMEKGWQLALYRTEKMQITSGPFTLSQKGNTWFCSKDNCTVRYNPKSQRMSFKKKAIVANSESENPYMDFYNASITLIPPKGTQTTVNHHEGIETAEASQPTSSKASDGVRRLRAVLVSRSYPDAVTDFCDLLVSSGMWLADDVYILPGADATLGAVQEAIKAIGEKSDGDDLLLFYYCGRGKAITDAAPLDEADGFDEALQLRDGYLVDDELLEWLKDSGVKNLALILDATYSGTNWATSSESSSNVSNTSSQTKPQQKAYNPNLGSGSFAGDFKKGRKCGGSTFDNVITMSLADNHEGFRLLYSEQPWEYYHQHPFTRYLFESFAEDDNGDGRISIEEAFAKVSKNVTDTLRKTFGMSFAHPQLYDGFFGEADIFPVGLPNCIKPPVNNTSEGAITLTGESGSISSTLKNATGDVNGQYWDDRLAGIWYKWTAPKDGLLTLKVKSDKEMTYLQAWIFDKDKLNKALTASTVKQGEQYYIFVADNYPGMTSCPPFELSWEMNTLDVLNNDRVENALALSGESGSLKFNNSNAEEADVFEQKHGLYPFHANNTIENVALNPVWFTYEAKNASLLTINSNGSTADTILHVLEGKSKKKKVGTPSLKHIAFNDDFNMLGNFFTSRNSSVTIETVAGQKYYIMLDSWVRGNCVLHWSNSPIKAPVNDDLRNAIEISGEFGSIIGSNIGATAEVNEPSHKLFMSYWYEANFPDHKIDRPLHSIWYKWTAPEGGWLKLSSFASGLGAIIGIHQMGDDGKLQPICKTTWTQTTSSSHQPILTVFKGETYYIALDSTEPNVQGETVLTWTLTAGSPDYSPFLWTKWWDGYYNENKDYFSIKGKGFAHSLEYYLKKGWQLGLRGLRTSNIGPITMEQKGKTWIYVDKEKGIKFTYNIKNDLFTATLARQDDSFSSGYMEFFMVPPGKSANSAFKTKLSIEHAGQSGLSQRMIQSKPALNIRTINSHEEMEQGVHPEKLIKRDLLIRLFENNNMMKQMNRTKRR